MPKIYRMTQRTNWRIFNFDPLLRSSMQQALENLDHERKQAEVLARSTSYQALQMEKNWQETTIQ
jgi:hypothetical protein